MTRTPWVAAPLHTVAFEARRGPSAARAYTREMKTVAVIGASADRRKFGNKALRAFRQAGYRVIPITPRQADVEGERAYGRVVDYPGTIDMATFYVPAPVGERVIEDVAAKGIVEVWFNPGSESAALLARARALGLQPVEACSIVGLGLNPWAF